MSEILSRLREMICCHCKQKIKANPRLKGNQQYCSQADCQQARKRRWKNEKIKSDDDFHQKQMDYVNQWRRQRPSHQYMNDYRQKNPDYVEVNRQKQRRRNEIRRQREKQEKIVKVDALLPTPVKINTYEMTSFSKDSSGKIVKVDTLMVQLKQIQPLSFRQPAFGR